MLRLTRPDAMPGGLRRRRIGRRVAFLGAAESARQEAADMYRQSQGYCVRAAGFRAGGLLLHY